MQGVKILKQKTENAVENEILPPDRSSTGIALRLVQSGIFD